MLFKILQVAIPFIWFGALGAISFMEAPLKFTAPNITLELGLGIGRIIFQTLNKIEIVLGILLLTSFVFARPKGKIWFYLFGAIAILLFLETVWLLPVLDERAIQVINGTAPPSSNEHLIYIAFDAIKFISLLWLGTVLAKQNLVKD
jgi:hypothetical protein